MALLDFFGTTPDYLGGLLGDDLNRYRQDAQQQALQAAALGLLQAGAPSRTPGGGALAIAQGLQMGQQAYKNALREGLGEKLTQMQLQDFMQKRADEQALRQQQQQAQRVLQGAFRPEQGMIGQTPWNVLRDEEGNLMPGANVRPAGLDINAVLPQLRALGPAGMQVLGQQLGVEKTLAELAKAQRPEGFTLGEGQVRYEVNPQGQIVPVASGAPKETTPSAVKEYEFAKSQGYQGSFADFKKEGRPQGTVVNVGEKTFSSEFGKGVAQNVENTFTAAQGAQGTLSRIETLKPLVSDGKVFAGPLSGATQVATRMADTLGVAGADATEKLRNTAVAMQQLAGLELNAAEQMKGQGAITEPERQLIKRAAGGDLTQMTAGEVNSLLGALEKTSKYKINAHNKNLERLRKNPATAELADYYNLEVIQPTPVVTPSAMPPGVRVRKVQ